MNVIQKEKFDKQTLLNEVNECKKKSKKYIFGSLILSILCYVAILIILEYNNYELYTFFQTLPIYSTIVLSVFLSFFSCVMGLRYIGFYFYKDDNYVEKKLASIKDGGTTPLEAHKNWVKLSLIIAIILVIIFVIVLTIAGIIDGNSSANNSTSPWETCLKCNGSGHVRNDLGYSVSCPRCNGVGYIP